MSEDPFKDEEPVEGEIRVSCPGKVLLIGGYTVLRSSPSLSLSLTSRFHVRLLPSPSPTLTIHSPQYLSTHTYTLTGTLLSSQTVSHGSTPHPNPYLTTPLQTALHHLPPLTSGFNLTLSASPTFYTSDSTFTSFPIIPSSSTPTGFDLKTTKTGLGSSACLITSLITSIILYYSPKTSVAEIETLSQTAHNLVQGKVGSGFDVSTAVYGSQIYTQNLGSRIVDKINIKRGRLLLGDVKEGSESGGMSKRVLKGSEDGEGEILFRKLKEVNEKAIEGYVKGERFGEGVRSAIQSLGTITNCEIEPSVRKNVLDETENIEGVEYACVPGAGGFDAICCVVREEAVDEVKEVWRKEGIDILDVQEDGEGIRIERF
ncbi:hypothetical protein TrST_g13604 [Triparma strigata]|uniref:phosphomevalonate kinase n=1 Tax=Triparma strigata TaxID=1606541 RepID=A0A9W7C3T1_9STRA|nr:hypothetical protein TrST_g13604 [Triparma strigata]